MILHNGPVYTMDPRLPQVRALSIAGDTIAGGVDVREGGTDAVGHERIDLEGRCVLPAFCDSHVHFLDWALARTELDLGGAASMAEALRMVGRGGGRRLAARARLARGGLGRRPADARGAGCRDGRPARRALGARPPHALGQLGRASERPGATGSGIVRERDAWDFPLPERTPLEQSRAVRAAMAAANARGVVAVHDYQRDRGRGLWQRLDADRRLTLRVHMSYPAEQIGAAQATELRTGFGSDVLRVGPVKAFMDGTLGSSTAWMLDGSGMVLTRPPRWPRSRAPPRHRASRSPSTRSATAPTGRCSTRSRRPGRRGRISPSRRGSSTCSASTTPTSGRLAELGVTASMQPVHQRSDRDIADRLWGERARCGYRWRDLLDSGAHLAFGSDAPIEDLDPLGGIDAAVNRDWYPDQRLDVADAVLAFTGGGAAAVGEHRRRGLLLPGYAADLVVLDTDIISHPDRIADTKVIATMLAGRWVHGRPPW